MVGDKTAGWLFVAAQVVLLTAIVLIPGDDHWPRPVWLLTVAGICLVGNRCRRCRGFRPRVGSHSHADAKHEGRAPNRWPVRAGSSSRVFRGAPGGHRHRDPVRQCRQSDAGGDLDRILLPEGVLGRTTSHGAIRRLWRLRRPDASFRPSPRPAVADPTERPRRRCAGRPTTRIDASTSIGAVNGNRQWEPSMGTVNRNHQ